MTLKSMSLKLVPFKSLDKYMAVSVAVCDMFSVKEWPDLENRVRVSSRSLKMPPVDRSDTSLNT